MAMISQKYHVKGVEIEVGPIVEAIKRESLTNAFIELRKALTPFEPYPESTLLNIKIRIINDKQLPSEKEIEDYLDNNDCSEKVNQEIIEKIKNPNAPKCPTCGSTKLTKQGAASRGLSGFFFGRHSVEGRAQWICQDCGFMW